MRLQRRAWELGLAALVEVHDDDELTRAIDSGARIIGVNNRNLRTLAVDVAASRRLGARIPADVVGVSESGLTSRADLEELAGQGYRAFLIGERFMTAPDPAKAIAELFGGVETPVTKVAHRGADPSDDSDFEGLRHHPTRGRAACGAAGRDGARVRLLAEQSQGDQPCGREGDHRGAAAEGDAGRRVRQRAGGAGSRGVARDRHQSGAAAR